MERARRLGGRWCVRGGLGWLLVLCCGLVRAADWLPIAPEELAATSEPSAPLAAAIYLYRQIDRNDDQSELRIYKRIKILREEGREHANIKIYYERHRQYVANIEARTIRPDGTIVEFEGKPLDQPIVKGQRRDISAKLLTLPDVQIGSIIEYRYTLSLDQQYVFDSNWVLNDDLFTKRAKFSLLPSPYFPMRWSWPLGLPEGTEAPKMIHGKVQMESSNIEPFMEEEHMPPESAVRMRVDFVYLNEDFAQKDTDKFWQHYAKRSYDRFDNFIDYRAAVEAAVKPLIVAGDSEEAKARKLYEWVQHLRNRSYEQRKSREENKREDLDPNKSVKDVLNHGYGWNNELNQLYVAMARAAGLEAHLVEVSTRDMYFFSKGMRDSNELNASVVQLKLGGQEIFVDPGTAFVPFGLLPWRATMATGLRLDKKSDVWLTTPTPTPAQGRVQRTAKLQLDEHGGLEGKLSVTFNGQAALDLRLDGRFDDATERKKTLEELVQTYVPTGIDVQLTNEPDWSSSAPTLTAEFDLKVPGWVQAAGNRAFAPATLFGNESRHEFDHATRRHLIYFSYPYEMIDDVTIRLPANLRVGTLAPAQHKDLTNLIYHMTCEEQDGVLHLRRQLTEGFVILPVKYYDDVRNFFQQVRAGDEQQVILQSMQPATAKKR